MLRVVESFEDVEDLRRWLSEQTLVAFDTETTGTSLYDHDFRVRTLQLGSVDSAWIMDVHRWRGLAQEVFRRYDGQLAAHHSRFDVTALAREEIEVPLERVDDTMIALRLAEPDKSAKLKEAAVRHVSAAAARGQQDLLKAMKINRWTWADIPIDFEPFQFYAALDTILTARLHGTPACKAGRASPVYDLEMEVRAACTKMEKNGLRVDVALSMDQAERYRDEAALLKATALSAHGVNLTSTEEVGRYLVSSPAREHMTKVTPSGRPCVDQEVLEAVIAYGGDADWARLAAYVLRVRKIEKLASTYFDHFWREADGDGIVHADIETLAARTGRMSVRTPPLQTLPAPSVDEDSLVVRKAVVPRRDGEVLIACDMNQIELRLIAALSGDPNLIGAFAEADEGGVDFFTGSARQVYEDPAMGKSDPRRATTKTYWYASAYGAGVVKMAWSAGVPVSRMQALRVAMQDTYPGFYAFMRRCEEEARANDGWIETPYGRRLKVPEDRIYVATNYKIQAAAADVLKRSIVHLAHAGLDEAMVVPVHDEVLFSIPTEDVDEANRIISGSMDCRDFAVPLTSTSSAPVDTWAACK